VLAMSVPNCRSSSRSSNSGAPRKPQTLCEDQDRRRPGLDTDKGHAPWRIKGRNIGVGGERMRGVHLGDVGRMRACVMSMVG
jgi:hypothetical protein